MRLSCRFTMVFLILITGSFVSLSAQAGAVFAPAYSYSQQSVETNGNSSDSKVTSLDLRLAYLDKSGLYLGGMYAMANGSSDSASSKTTAIGPSVGFNAKNGFFVIFTYFLTAQHKITDGPKYTDGMGPQIDLGWIFPLTESLFLGPQMTYRSINYTKSETGGVSATTDTTYQSTVPYITMWYKF